MINKVILLGRLGKDAELSYTTSQIPVLKASIATTERFKDKEGKYIDKTEWHRLIMFGKRAEGLSKYMTKGSLIYAEGKIQTSSWTDKDGVKKYSTDIIISEIKLCGDFSAKNEVQKESIFDTNSEEKKKEMDPIYDDLPF